MRWRRNVVGVSLEEEFYDIREIILKSEINIFSKISIPLFVNIYTKVIYTVQKMLGEVDCTTSFSLLTVNVSHLPVVTCYEVNYELSGAGTIFQCKSSQCLAPRS